MPSTVEMINISPQELQAKWRNGPIQFSKDFFNSTLWEKQEEIMLSVRDNPRTTVRSCNSGGKSKVAAEIVLWFLLSHYPSKVIITAPTFLQVEKILWKEIAALYHKSVVPIGGDLLATELKLNDEWFALGISTDEVNRFQGFKSPHLLVIMDEALGINPIIWEAVEGLLPYRILAMANPLAPEGEFYKTFSSSLWNKIYISAQDAIDWQKAHGDIPGLVNQQWVDERKEEWGEKSPLYQARVLGEFPQEWTNAVVSLVSVNRSRKVKIDVDEDDVVKVLAIDVASKHGDNLTVFTYRHNNKIKKIVPKPGYSMIDIANTVKQDLALGDVDTVVIDSDGLGEGLGDIFDNYHLPYLAFHGGTSSKPIETIKFSNLRTQFYYMVSNKFEKDLYDTGEIDNKQFDILKNQLCSIRVKSPDNQGRSRIETKDDMRARTMPSPDYADSFMMSEFGYYMGRVGEITPRAWC